jgi:hypothetical protein
MELGGQLHAPTLLSPGKDTGNITGLDVSEKVKIPVFCRGFEPQIA